MAVTQTELDPITLEVYWNRLVTIMSETDVTLLRTAVSTIVGEVRDFAFVLLDAEARGLAQSTNSLTVFTGIQPYAARHLLKIFPPETLEDGDILLTNDPWIAAGHLPDFCFVKPVFYRRRRIAYVTCLVHMADVAGNLSYFAARDIFEEGVYLPPCKIYSAGKPNDDIINIIRANSRVAEMAIGDLRAVLSALHVATERLRDFLQDYGLDDLAAISDNIQRRSEGAMRAAIGRIPDGDYHHAITIDGYAGHEITIAAGVTVDGDRLRIDYTGSSAETYVGGINVCLNYTRGSTLAAIKSALTPEIPSNEGLFRSIEVTAPEGSILHCRKPVPVKARSIVAVHACEAIFGALASVIPDKVMAGGGTFWGIWVNGRYADGRPFNAVMLPNGGMGASGRKDGLSTTAYPWNMLVPPTEVFENQVPLYVTRKEMIPDSGGAGQFRGGRGQRVILKSTGAAPVTITLRPVNLTLPPPGLLGGEPAGLARVLVNGQPTAETLLTLQSGDEMVCEISGGGGFGPVSLRSPDLRAQDAELARLGA